MGLIKAKKISNADVLRQMLDIDKAYSKEHEGEQILTDKTREAIEYVINNSKDDFEINRKFNAILKANTPEQKKKLN